MFKIQNVLLRNHLGADVIRHMYYRIDDSVLFDKDGEAILEKGKKYDFMTYFNSLSLQKWKKYSNASKYYLIVEIKGEFTIQLVGLDGKKNNHLLKRVSERIKYNCSAKKETIIMEIPENETSEIVSFWIVPKKNTVLYYAYYAVDIDDDIRRVPFISMVTTTFKKEEYVKRNIKLLESNLFNENEYMDKFCWNIIDNGRTLDASMISCNGIQLYPNKNVGGAGGFARGMIESLSHSQNPTHILLMDDDVIFLPESFKRLYALLSCLKEDYMDYFVSGAMLKMAQPNVQHEDIGMLNSKGYHEAVKPNLDMNLIESIVENEEYETDEQHMYAAWWFCCIPTTVARLDNLPIPVFVRGDDVEYSLRNNAKFITMNGICIWHEGFEGKFSAAMEYYQVCRNELAVVAMHPELSNVDVIGHIKMLFWEEMYKYNYKGASLLLDAVEDYMKGPEFFEKLDGEKSMKNKKEQDNKLEPITDEIREYMSGDIYQFGPIESMVRKAIYNYSYNGQARLPECFAGKKTTVIPYGWGYYPKNQVGAKRIIAVDLPSDKYVVYERSRSEFRKLKSRFNKLMEEYEKDEKRIKNKYINSVAKITGNQFWDTYLGI